MNYDAIISDLSRLKQEISSIWNILTDDNTTTFDMPPIDPGFCLDILEILERQRQEIENSEKYKKWREENFYG